MSKDLRNPGSSHKDWLDRLEGTLLQVDARRPLFLRDPRKVWIVMDGHLDVFRVPVEEDVVAGARQYLMRLEASEAAFGFPSEGAEKFALIAAGATGTQVKEVSRESLHAFLSREDSIDIVAGWVDRWIAGLLASMTPGPPPPGVRLVEDRETVKLEPHQALSCRGVIWLEVQEGGLQYPAGEEISAKPGTGLVPVSDQGWLSCEETTTVLAMSTREVLALHGWQPLDLLHTIAISRFAQLAEEVDRSDQARVESRKSLEAGAMAGALANVLAVSERGEESIATTAMAGQGDPLMAAVREVGRASGIHVKEPSSDPRAEELGKPERLRRIANASQFRFREIALRGEWWKEEGTAFLGFRGEGASPCAVIPSANGRYKLFDPESGQYLAVETAVAGTLGPVAYILYRPFPDHRLTWRDLVRFAGQGISKNTRRLILAALAAAVIGLLTPIATGVIFGDVIPNAEIPFLYEIMLALIAAAIGKAAFDMTRAITVLRLEGKLNSEMQAAVWDRLLRLPTSFFRGYTAGDLTMRAMGVDMIQQVLSGVTVSATLAGVFSIVNFGLMFYYDVGLALIAVLAGVLFVLATAVINIRQVSVQSRVFETEGKVTGLLLQLLNGIAKLRVAGAEARAFKVWTDEFSQQRTFMFRGRQLANSVVVINSVLPVLSSIALFAFIAYRSADLSIANFLAFNAAFGQFLAAAMGMNAALTGSIILFPLYDRLTPILEAVPEVDEVKSNPGELSGQIDINNVIFRYQEEGPIILDDVTFTIQPGEFVAFVGPSGSGKSTLFRLLLGFEAPESGTIFYDGKNLSGIDLRAVRKQLGVVLQNGALMPGSIFENIVGSEPLTVDDAWEAARMAGLDKDIESMPMGMHTMVAEGAGTLSGGQRQRLIIARALVRRPRILLFDEATSALDNRTQEIVSRSLDQLNATRIVIAHRLSTIQNADRIFVLEAGHLLQQGTFEELMAVEGPFATLAKRQIV